MPPTISVASRPKKYFSRFKDALTPMPNLIQAQLDSFKWFIEEGIGQALKEFSPIKDYADKKFELSFGAFEVSLPKYDEEYAKTNKLSYEGQFKATVKLKNKIPQLGQRAGDIPLRSAAHDAARHIHHQRHRARHRRRSSRAHSAYFFTLNEVSGRNLFGAKIIPARGVWIEIETDTDGAIIRPHRPQEEISHHVAPAHPPPAQAGGAETDEAIKALFKGDEAAAKSSN